MPELEIPMDVEVHIMEGSYGHADSVVVDPIQEKVTHIVVRQHKPPHAEKLVPIHFVQVTSPQQINLARSLKQMKEMSDFARQAINSGGPPSEAETSEHVQMPPGEITIRRGTRVDATDGPIGHVGELLIDRKTGNISHLVLEEGHMWGKKDIAIPVGQIERMDEAEIQLKVSKKDVEALPHIVIHRRNGRHR